MRFQEMGMPGAFQVDLEKHGDDRGFFARAWCKKELSEHDLNTGVVQANLSLSRQKGTLRGLHFQLPPAAETKFIRCTRGAILDVILDIRPDSPTHGQWEGVELSEGNRRAVYVPEGFAHGFQTLTDDAEVFYLVTAYYAPDLERGIRHDDPAFGIEWPLDVTEISDKDRSYPDYEPASALEGLYQA